MGNHYHLVVETREASLDLGMRDLNGDYARGFNGRHKRCDHLFGRRYWAEPIDDGAQLEDTLLYVWNNPVRAGLVSRAESWPWSSLRGVRPIDSLLRVTRHRQADPPALARLLPDGGTASDHGARRQAERRGLLGDVGRGFRAPLLLRSRRARGTRS